MLVIPPEPTTVGLPIGDLTYEVQPGDTLSIIAERVYGDPAAFGPIAQANGITDTSPLQVGQVLVIPPNPD
jgi:nucleoid-associated protein YgaU